MIDLKLYPEVVEYQQRRLRLNEPVEVLSVEQYENTLEVRYRRLSDQRYYTTYLRTSKKMSDSNLSAFYKD